ncbi:SDR family NAD(P)-dependent oxidoreductase [Dietzia sp. MNB45]|uniref:SDR family NAD(P)-dependent oxidoreductase n=1 Tax=Dietzia sp. MNB45 TaxID=3238800 RepID=UPI003F7D5A58
MSEKRIDIPDLTGETWLVTGATNGVGLETVRSASRHGARVVLAVRDTARGAKLAEELHGEAWVVELDLASLESVRRAAAEVAGESIDVLVNNAGTVTPRRRETADGFEMLLGVNLLGPFLFTNLVLPQVRRRVVIVASNAHTAGHLNFDDPYFRSRKWLVAGAYAQSKLGDMVWGLALDRRLRAAGSGVDVQLTHPGWAATNLSNATDNARVNRVITAVSGVFAQPAGQAALTTMYAATRDLPSCSYVGPDAWWHMRGMPTLIGRSAQASDPEIAERLWEFATRETASG